MRDINIQLDELQEFLDFVNERDKQLWNKQLWNKIFKKI